MALPTWSELLASMREELRGSSNMARRRGAQEFAEWAEQQHLPLFGVDEATVLTAFEKSLEHHRRMKDNALTAQGQLCVTMAKELLQRGKRYENGDPNAATEQPAAEQPASTTPSTPEEQMAPKRTDEQQFEQEMEQEMEEQFEEEADEDAVFADEEPQPKPRSQRPPPVRVQVVQAPPRGHRRAVPAVERAQPRSSALKGILPRPEKVRLYKRNELGKRELIDDFTVDEIGDMKLESFIRQYIHPQWMNDGIDTEYIAYELDARTGNEKQPPASITLRAEQQQEPQHDPFNTVRKAMGMLQEMQGFAQPQQQVASRNPMMEAAQQKAAASGDFNGMMMLMMMDQMMSRMNQPQGPNGDLLLKVLDRLEKVERGTRGPREDGPPSFGPPPGFGPPGFGPPGFGPGFGPPPPFYPPPRRDEERGTDKLLDLAMAKLAQPPPSLADSVKELMALQSIMQPKNGDSSEVAALRAELRAMTEKLAPRPADSLEASLATFEKLTTIAKSVTQQTGGDSGGFLKNLITPEVGKVIAGIVTQAQQQAAQQPQQPPIQHVPAQQVAQQVAQHVQPPPPPRDPNKPPLPPPPAVVEAVKAFQLAQTPEVQAQRFVDVVLAMYLSEDPFYRKLLQPALDDLNKAEESVERLNMPRRTVLQLVFEMQPKLTTPDFADACIAALAQKAGVEKLPDTLLNSRGKWTLKDGNVVMLEDFGAKAVVEEQKDESKVEQSKVEQAKVIEPVEVTEFKKPEPVPVTA